jgi:hypothetical protein
VFVGAKAFVLMIMFIGSMGHDQRQQGKRQSEKQTAHDESPEVT